MPVVNVNSDIAGPNTGVDPAKQRGRPFAATGSVANGATDSIGSKYLICRVPSEAILDTRTFFKVDTWGFANIRIGTFTDPAALVSQTRALEAVATPVDVGDAKHGMPFWQACGMAADPGGEIAVYMHGLVADATAAGTCRFEVHYRHR
ncbi:hypothetical protein [Rhodoferax sp.]|uniref:hypothetical protein n=1 Tax=Rhodoferax sp. TaxID=50421 RepID=UPI002ACECD60|nr:hypothetical protein [Rhodoferax sp.]MDZ7919981.1 hypothetical protein [Rhodoferax sp.]